MADIMKPSSGAIAPWDPLQTMRELMRWDPFREMAPLSLSTIMPRLERIGWNPSFEVRENKDAYLFKADLPGAKKEDIEVTLTGNRLQIRGHREHEKETKEETFYACEREYGAFTRAFTMPEGADIEHVKSELKDGVLTVVVPKRAEAHARKIPIATATTKS